MPRSLYRFDTRTFYVLLTLDGRETAHPIGGGGTAQLARALQRFLAAARERFGLPLPAKAKGVDGVDSVASSADDGDGVVPAEFVFRQWEGLGANLERLGRLLRG